MACKITIDLNKSKLYKEKLTKEEALKAIEKVKEKHEKYKYSTPLEFEVKEIDHKHIQIVSNKNVVNEIIRSRILKKAKSINFEFVNING